MAYDALKPKKDNQANKPGANPYDQVIGATGSIAEPSGAPGISPNGLGGAMQGMAAPGQPAPRGFGGDSGPSATGYVNFDRLYNANAGVAQREAGARSDAIAKQAGAAKQGLAGAQSKFQSGLTGAANTGPTADDYSYATGGQKFGQGEAGGIAEQPNAGAPSVQIPGGGQAMGLEPAARQRATKSEAEWRSGLEAGAKSGYSGPNALSGMDEYAKLTQDTAAAQDAAMNPLVGMNKTDAALLGAAGRPRFEADKVKYGGLKSDLAKANEASFADAKARQAADAEARGNYERLLSDYDRSQGIIADEKAAEDAKKKSAGDKIAEDAATRAKFINYLHGGSEGDHWRNSLHDVGDMLSPSDWIANAAGEQGLRERAENAINPMGAENTSNVWNDWQEDDWDVWASMTESDWAAFAGMNDGDKRRWIDARKAQLRGGG